MADVMLRQVSKRFGTTEAVRDLSLAIEDGGVRRLARSERCRQDHDAAAARRSRASDAGAILIDGRDVTQAPPGSRDMAFVFQQYSLYPHLSVYD